MSKTLTWFETFYAHVRETANWRTMENTVEASEWHREANVAVHTDMCIQHYIKTTAAERSEREQVLTLMTLLFHDFGKPEAEERKPKKDGSGEYNTYAGHEPKSANEFLSFMCSHEDLTMSFFEQGFSWEDVRKIKFMIENHLPFGIKNETKRQNLKAAVVNTLGDDVQCFYDQLWSDCNGRISDDHETKRQNVLTWVAEFAKQKAAPFRAPKVRSPFMFVLVGPVGAGKSTFIEKNFDEDRVIVSEDIYRVEFAKANFSDLDHKAWLSMEPKEQYATAWQFCFDNSKAYDQYAREQLMKAVASGKTVILDRTNQTRKSRSPWIQAAKQAGYHVVSIEFFVSEATSKARQKTRTDKDVPEYRVHQIYTAFEVPWLGVEVDDFQIVPPFGPSY